MNNKKYAKCMKLKKNNSLKKDEYVLISIDDNHYEFECGGEDAMSKLINIELVFRDAEVFLDKIYKMQQKDSITPEDVEEIYIACVRRVELDFNGKENLPRRHYEISALHFGKAIGDIMRADEDEKMKISINTWAIMAYCKCLVEIEDFNTFFEKIGSNMRVSF